MLRRYGPHIWLRNDFHEPRARSIEIDLYNTATRIEYRLCGIL